MFRVTNSHIRSFLIIKRTFYEPPRGGYPVPVYDRIEKLNFLQRVRKACYEFKSELKKCMQELRSGFTIHPYTISSNEDDIVWKFDGTQQSLDQWIVNSDKDYFHGYSNAKLELSPDGTGIFHGILDTRTRKDGKTTSSGYCNITTIPKLKSFKRKDFYNWHGYNELVLRIRGDGRHYVLNILEKGYWDLTWYNSHNYVMYTRGGPYWQIVRIPFSKFLFTTKGTVNENQYPLLDSNITNFGITLADKKPGPFRLEIDYIAVCYNPNISETFAYELNDIHKEIANNR